MFALWKVSTCSIFLFFQVHSVIAEHKHVHFFTVCFSPEYNCLYISFVCAYRWNVLFLLDDIQVIIFHGAFKVSNKLAMLTFLSYYLWLITMNNPHRINEENGTINRIYVIQISFISYVEQQNMSISHRIH